MRQRIALAAIGVGVAYALFAFGAVYPRLAWPLSAGTVALAALVRPAIARRGTRLLDGALLAFLAAIAIQLAPLPRAAWRALSPHAADFYRGYLLSGDPPARLSLDARATAQALATAGTVILFFWSCRAVLDRGGSRQLARAVAWMGACAALVAAVQHGGPPGLIYWHFRPPTPGAVPFGPMLNRNTYATWMVAALPLTIGYIMTRIRSRRHPLPDVSFGRRVRRALDGRTLWLSTAAALMIFMLGMSLSRSGLVAFGGAMTAWMVLISRRVRAQHALLVVLGLVAVSILANHSSSLGAMVLKFGTGAGPAEGPTRVIIWRETLHVVRDFWLTGTGLGAYPTAMLVYQQSWRSLRFNHAHSEYLQLAAEGGLLLIAPAIVAVAAFTRGTARALRADRSPVLWLRAGAVAALIGIAIQSIWEVGVRTPANALLCALCAAIALHRPRVSHEGNV